MKRSFDPIYIKQYAHLDNLIKKQLNTISTLSDMAAPQKDERHQLILRASMNYLTELKKIERL